MRALWIAAVALAACASPAPRAAGFDPRALPAGPLGASIAYGHEIFVNTARYMPAYVRADMSCSSCHLADATQPRGGTLAGTYARFPQWNRRAHRVIALQDRIAECFLYSMNGRAPGYASREMVAIVAYIAWLSRGVSVGATEPPSDSFVEPLPAGSPDASMGAQLYQTKCAACHRSDGAGVAGFYPPLWGARSFNRGAGMAHLDRMTGFVRYNMPQDAPGSLSLAQAYDVSAFVLGHPRPAFRKNVLVVTPSLPAKYY